VPVRLKKSFLLSAISLVITAHLNAQLHANSIVVHKKARTMDLIHGAQVIKTYKIALGGEPIGPKTKQGDHRTPEGMYVIDSRNLHNRQQELTQSVSSFASHFLPQRR
jgi:murein L,D-transpeptidase YafK